MHGRQEPTRDRHVFVPDSFGAMDVSPEFGVPHVPRPYHGRVFRLDELAELIDTYGLPASELDEDYTAYERRTSEKYIEVQLWSDEPVRAFFRPGP